jgi:formylmethanofuran dehydrogenase subunit E
MESVDYFDRYLDPPEYSNHSNCDACNEIFDNNDLNEIDGIYLCDSCLETHKSELTINE